MDHAVVRTPTNHSRVGRQDSVTYSKSALWKGRGPHYMELPMKGNTRVDSFDGPDSRHHLSAQVTIHTPSSMSV